MTNETNDGGQAFPQLNSTGMTLRDWFAGQVIGAIVGKCSNSGDEDVARMAYNLAAAMIEARKG